MSTHPRLTRMALVAFALLMHSLPLLAQAPKTRPQTKKTMITLTNPVSGIKLTFRKPAFLDTPVNKSVWTEIVVQTKDDSFTVTAPDQTGYLINDDDNYQRFWSPDGHYISLYRVYGILSKTQFSGMAITFIALEYGETVDFASKKGTTITTDNFTGWAKGKPHTALAGKADEAEPQF